jgi:long-chain fatty acid transport protein
MDRRVMRVLCAACVCAALQGQVQATGFFVNQQSVRALGRVNAGAAAAADDASTVFFNAAGLAYLWHDQPAGADAQAIAGVQLLIPRSRSRDRGSFAATPGTLGQPLPTGGEDGRDPSKPTPIPNLHYARRLGGGKAFLGLGVGVPFGLSARFSDAGYGRYDAIESSLETVNLSAVAAYAVSPRLALAVGLDMQYAKTRLVSAIPDPLTPGGPVPATDGRNVTEGDAWTPGFNLGIAFQPAPVTRIGASYRSAMRHRISGTSTTSNLGGPLAAANGEVGARAALALPAIASIGVVHALSAGLRAYAQADWLDWSRFGDIRIRYADGRPDAVRRNTARDTWAASAGGDYAASERLVLRAGLRYDQTPTVDGSRDVAFPDAPRLWAGVGGSYRLSAATTADFALKHAFFRKATVDVTRTFFEGTPVASAARVRGEVDSSVTTFAFSLTHSF